jgi:hypothetical protein
VLTIWVHNLEDGVISELTIMTEEGHLIYKPGSKINILFMYAENDSGRSVTAVLPMSKKANTILCI